MDTKFVINQLPSTAFARSAASKRRNPYFIKKIYGNQKHKSIRGFWQAGYELKSGNFNITCKNTITGKPPLFHFEGYKF